MTLAAGTRIGPYEIVAPIGAGGMGEVYRGRDPRLDRDVAIKILPPAFAADAERLARFAREAKTLASLNHPHIAQIYGLEVAQGLSPADTSSATALVMELVEGDDLSVRIARGALPMAEAVAIAIQVAGALEAAHERAIVHRDLKPGNIKVGDDGTVKVLDFGLAKVMDPSAGSNPDLMNSPTITSPATQMGMILGTAAYMSPEQARGRPVDRRADIWAFGAVLYEMLTGRRPFGGEDISLTLAAILKDDADFTALPPDTPAAIRRVLRRCLEKDPRKRLSAIADARLELEEGASDVGDGAVVPGASGHTWRTPALAAAAGLLAGMAILAIWMTLRQSPPPAAAVVRSDIELASTPLVIDNNRGFWIDPAGTEIVFVGQAADQPSRLYRRRLADDVPAVIPGTDHAFGPFFSQDGQWLVFTQLGRLKKMPAAGGGAVDLGDVGGAAGASFLPDGDLILNPNHGEGLFRVPASGGPRVALTTVAHDRGEAGHHWPHVLPGGTKLVFTVEIDGKPYSEARIELLTLATGERRTLFEGTDARYVSSGHLLYWREGDVWRVPFDPARGQVTGAATAVLRNVMTVEANGQSMYSVADNGTAVYVTGRDPHEERDIVLVNRAGVARRLSTERRAFEAAVISPDGRQLAVTIIAANDSLWTMEIGRSPLTRITFESENARPVWSPDGARLAFSRYAGGEARRLFVMPADGSAAPELLRDSGGRSETAESWSTAGVFAFVRHETSGVDIWVLDLEGKREARAFLAMRFNEYHPRFSPDGKWIAYASDESGRVEVYVRPYPGPGQKRLISSGGGNEPRWRGDGRELFYRNGDQVLAVDIAPGPPLGVSLPRVLFTGPYHGSSGSWGTWDVMPDGQGFVLIQDAGRPRTAISLVQNWFAEIRKP